jgi:hypothetical protein
MAEKEIPNQKNNSDEIDLGQLFKMIGNGFNNLFKAFLRLFLYFKKNAIILLALVIVGAGIGYGLSKIISKKLKTEVIVKPQMDSKNYLYDVIDEIQANLRARDTAFFKSIGIDDITFEGLEISIGKVQADGGDEGESKYLELLQSFENTDAISDIVRAELQNKSSFNHRIIFLYNDAAKGQDFAKKVMDYINGNEYFTGLIAIYMTNATSRIKENQQLLIQVDEIITNYAKNMGTGNVPSGNDRIVLDNKESLNITGLFELKNSLIKDIESKKIELEDRTEVIKVINFGSTQPVKKSFFAKAIVIIPLALIGLFFLISFLRYLNRRAAETL